MKIKYPEKIKYPVAAVCLSLFLFSGTALAQQDTRENAPGLVDTLTEKTRRLGKVTRGKFRVFENRQARSGKMIHLDYVVLHAKSDDPQPDPFFFIAGGPGQAVVTVADNWADHWIRDNRDVVFINQRGTAGDNYLAFEITEGDSLQQYLESLWEPELVQSNLDRLSEDFDLTQYSTCNAADDLNDFRKAMGYEQINIAGASYGTRASLVYIRQHGDTVRTAMLEGCAPIEFRNPLYHAPGAQRAIDMIFDEVEANEEYREAFGDLRSKFSEIVERLDKEPVIVEVTNQSNGNKEEVTLTRGTFASAVRFQMYYSGNSRRLPKLLDAAYDGDYKPFMLNALRQNIGLRQSIAMGMLLSVTSAEDVARIDPAEVEEITGHTFTGNGRVLSQMAAAELWPKSELPPGYGEPVQSNVQTLIMSGTIDPVTPPEWGEMVHKNFPNSIHVLIPTAHDIGGPCVESIQKQFLETGTVDGLDTNCVQKMELPPLEMPGEG